MTNYERIKQMSVDEMADFLDYVYLDGYYDKEHNAVYGTMYDKEWLKQEVTKDGQI